MECDPGLAVPLTSEESLIHRHAGDFSSLGHEADLVLGVGVQVTQVVLGVRGGELHCMAIGGVQTGSVGNRHAVHLRHRLEPGDQGRGVGHVTYAHLAGGVDPYRDR